MKKRALYFLLFLTLTIGTCFSQEVYKGQIVVKKQLFTKHDNLFHVEMSVDYEGVKLPSNESLTFSPIIKNGDKSLELPSVLINGPQKQKVFRRKQTLKSRNKGLRMDAPAIVVKDNKKKSRSFSYKVDIPYQDWMTGSALYIETKECGCNGKEAQVYHDKLADGLDITRAPKSIVSSETDRSILSWVNPIAPLAEDAKFLKVKGVIPMNQTINIWGNKNEEKQNYEIYYRLRDAIQNVAALSGSTLVGVKLKAFTSPIGDFRKNEKKGFERSLSLKEYLRSTHVSGKSPIDLVWISEDWDSIKTLVKGSDMMFKDAVLDIIQTVDVEKGRERMLADLADGIPYKYLKNKVFNQIDRVEYSIEYSRLSVNPEDGKLLLKTTPNSLSLTDFFAVANSYSKGSAEYNDVFDLAARLFPDNAIANINAAGIALTKKDVKKARKYLERFSTLPAASCNMGILCLLEGNVDKAEVYLEMAKAAGVSEASSVLNFIKNKNK